MQCTHPVTLKSPEGIPLVVPCGRCMPCRITRTEEWAIRLVHEAKCHDEKCFCTLTYDDENIPQGMSLCKQDMKDFIANLKCYARKFKYFLSGEYGDETGRPHYHAILFGYSKRDKDFITNVWNKGFVTISDLNLTRARYTAKYIQKKLGGCMSDGFYKDIEKEFMLCSKGIGKKFADKFLHSWIDHGFIMHEGVKVPIPRYYKKLVPLEYLEALKMRQGFRKLKEEVSESEINDESIYKLHDRKRRQLKQKDVDIEKFISMKKSQL